MSLPLLSPTVDFVFKQIFGRPETRDVLAAFLNAVLDRTGPKALFAEDLTLVNPNLEKEHLEDKYSILDVRVKTAEGEQLNIEIQVTNERDMHVRAVYYNARLFTEQLGSGQDYLELKKTISIIVLDFELLPLETYHAVFHLWEDRARYCLTELIELHFLELPKLWKVRGRVDTPLSRWLMYLKGIPDEMLEVWGMSEPMLKKARTIQEVLSQSEEARALYELRFKALHDREAREGRYRRLEAAVAEMEATLSEKTAELSEKEKQVQALQDERLKERREGMQSLLRARFGAEAERLAPLVAQAAARESAVQLLPELVTAENLESVEALLRDG